MASILIVNSRSFIDRANKHGEEMKKKGHLVQVLGKVIKLRGEDKQFLPESNINGQKLDAVEGTGEIHVFWDGEELDTVFVCGMAFALGKDVKVIYSGSCGTRRYFWDCKEKRTYEKG